MYAKGSSLDFSHFRLGNLFSALMCLAPLVPPQSLVKPVDGIKTTLVYRNFLSSFCNKKLSIFFLRKEKGSIKCKRNKENESALSGNELMYPLLNTELQNLPRVKSELNQAWTEREIPEQNHAGSVPRNHWHQQEPFGSAQSWLTGHHCDCLENSQHLDFLA